MVDGDYGDVVDAVLLWWRDDDGDLVDALVDSLTDLVGGGAIWLLTPKVGRPGAVDPADIAEAAPIAGLRQTTTRSGQQGLGATRLVAPKSPGLSRDLVPRDAPGGGEPCIADSSSRPARAPPAPARRSSAGSGLVRPYPPGPARPRSARARASWGTGPAGGFTAWRPLPPTRRAHRRARLADLRRDPPRTNALARALASRGVEEGDGVAIMCRNHRGFVDATVAVAKLGADVLYLNTAFAGPQLVEVLEREKPGRRSSTTRSSPGCSTAADGRAPGLAWADGADRRRPTRSSR